MALLNKIGSLMALFGVLAIVFGFLDRVPSVLVWIYNWGESTAWVIKIGLIVVGGAMWLISNRMMSKSSVEIDTSEQQAE